MQTTTPSITEDMRAVFKGAKRSRTRKEVAARLGVPAGNPALATALQELIDDGALIRTGSVGAGYRYWPGNI